MSIVQKVRTHEQAAQDKVWMNSEISTIILGGIEYEVGYDNKLAIGKIAINRRTRDEHNLSIGSIVLFFVQKNQFTTLIIKGGNIY